MKSHFFVAGSCGLLGQGDQWKFGGDNRGYRTPDRYVWPYDQPDYRLMVMAVANWDNPATSRLILGKGVGATHLYNWGTLQETRTAAATGIQIVSQSSTTAFASVHWQGNIGNPFCVGSSIAFDVQVNMFRNGTIDVYGSHRPAPSYEMYGRWNDAAGNDFFGTLYRRDTASLNCLVPGACPDVSAEVHMQK